MTPFASSVKFIKCYYRNVYANSPAIETGRSVPMVGETWVDFETVKKAVSIEMVLARYPSPCQDRSKNTPHHKPAANPPWDRRRR